MHAGNISRIDGQTIMNRRGRSIEAGNRMKSAFRYFGRSTRGDEAAAWRLPIARTAGIAGAGCIHSVDEGDVAPEPTARKS
jgi:hypothetical protein